MKKSYFFLFLLAFAICGCQNQSQQGINSANPMPTNQNQLQDVNARARVNAGINKPGTNSNIPQKTAAAQVPAGSQAASTSEQAIEPPVIAAPKDNQAKPSVLPTSVDLPVAFASQAPYGNWDPLHEEACEEASMIMAVNYFKNLPLSAHIMEQGILNVIKWETDQGYKVDVNAQETVDILKNYFSLSAALTADISTDNIKKQLAEGSLILVPAAGRQLGNPNYTGLGPIYHMLVIRGYDAAKGEFITNDPGTRKGNGYRYKYQTLINAIHDWNHDQDEDGMTDEEMEQGRQVLIIVNK